MVQEIFYQLSRMDNLVKPVEQTAAWLFRVARNMMSNWKKKKEEDTEELQDLMDFLGVPAFKKALCGSPFKKKILEKRPGFLQRV